MNQIPIRESNHGTLAHPLATLLTNLLIIHNELLHLTHDLRLMDLQLQRKHQPVNNLSIVFVPGQPLEHSLKERRQVLALHQISGQQLQRSTAPYLIRVRIEQLH